MQKGNVESPPDSDPFLPLSCEHIAPAAALHTVMYKNTNTFMYTQQVYSRLSWIYLEKKKRKKIPQTHKHFWLSFDEVSSATVAQSRGEKLTIWFEIVVAFWNFTSSYFCLLQIMLIYAFLS